MALTLDLLNAQEGLSGLTDEQKNALVGLSERDEEASFNKRFGETLGQMDTVIASEGAIQRNEGEKTSEYMARVIRTLKSSADEGAGYKATNESLTAEVDRLKKQIENGATDAELKQRVAKLEGDLASAKKINGELQDSLTKKEAEYKGKLEGYRMESEINAALNGLTIKKEYAEPVKQTLLDVAKQKVLAAKHVFDETAGMFIFQDADGNPRQDKSLKNLTVADVLREQLDTMGVLETQRVQTGTGHHGNPIVSTSNVDLSMARTQSEATDIIERQLMSQGHAKGDADWSTVFNQAYDDNAAVIEKLPLR